MELIGVHLTLMRHLLIGRLSKPLLRGVVTWSAVIKWATTDIQVMTVTK
jgi:hypothetical protein